MSKSTDEMLREGMPDKLAPLYYKRYGCVRCESKRKKHYRFALCRDCYDLFTERMEAIESSFNN
jgi:hypothetical protein